MEMQKSELGRAFTFRDLWRAGGGGEIEPWNVGGKEMLLLSPCRTEWGKTKHSWQ